MRLLKFFIVILVFASISFFVANCEKELLVVPEEEVYDLDSSYEYGNGDFYIDSIVIHECAGPMPYGEYPDIMFVFNLDTGSVCVNTSNQILSNVQPNDLPITLILINPLIFYNAPLRESGEVNFKATEFDPGQDSCAVGWYMSSVTFATTTLGNLQDDHENVIHLFNSNIAYSVYFRFS